MFLLGSAVVFTGALVLVTAKIGTTYIHNFPFYFDPSAYYRYNLMLCKRLRNDGLLAAVQFELAENFRHPLRTLLVTR